MNARIIKCPKCRKTNMGNITQCLICGTPLPANVSSTQGFQSANTSGIKCNVCGTICPAGMQFCNKCGAKLQQLSTPPVSQTKFCTKCGAPRPKNSKFCTSCGNRFDS